MSERAGGSERDSESERGRRRSWTEDVEKWRLCIATSVFDICQRMNLRLVPCESYRFCLNRKLQSRQEGQDKIYFVTGEGRRAAEIAPAMEKMRLKETT